MRNLFFVSVACCIFTGTSLSATAQKLKNTVSFNDGIAKGQSPKFMDDIEIKADVSAVASTIHEEPAKVQVVPATKHLINDPAPINIENVSSVQFKYAQLLNRDVEQVKNLSLYNFIEEWWGTRYRYGGTTKKGIDCSAFTGLLIGTAFAVRLPRTAREQYNETERVSKENMLEGDLVFFNTRGGVSHVGVYLGDGYFVHASVNSGVTISSLDDPYYENRFISGGRFSQQNNSTEE